MDIVLLSIAVCAMGECLQCLGVSEDQCAALSDTVAIDTTQNQRLEKDLEDKGSKKDQEPSRVPIPFARGGRPQSPFTGTAPDGVSHASTKSDTARNTSELRLVKISISLEPHA